MAAWALLPWVGCAREPSSQTSQRVPTHEDFVATLAQVKAQVLRDGAPKDTQAVLELVWSLRGVANGGEGAELRANAALLAASLEDERGAREGALAFVALAHALMPDAAEPFVARAHILSKTHASTDLERAAQAAEQAVRRAPDDLSNHLLLGQLQLRAGHPEASAAAYAQYETRRAELINGLTLQKDGVYVLGEDARVANTAALATVPDEGTANAFIFALKTDPVARVRVAVARAMAQHRLVDYLPALLYAQTHDASPEVVTAIGETIAVLEGVREAAAPKQGGA